MTLKGFKDFVLKRMLVAYLVLIPPVLSATILVLGVMVSQSLLSLVSFSAQFTLVLVGTWIMFRKFEEERLTDFTKKLEVLLEQLEDRITSPAYIYSLSSIALEIARNKEVSDTQAWDKLLTKHSEDLTNNVIALSKRIEADRKQFRVHLNDVRQTLTSLKKFRKSFYDMISEARHLAVYYNSSDFKKRYERFSEEYNRCMDSLKLFSTDIQVKFAESLDENLTEHVKGFDELFRNLPIVDRL